MSDEVYEGAIGIDLGTQYSQNYPTVGCVLTLTTRHDLLLRCQLRGHQCRDQYAPPILRLRRHPSNNVPPVANEQGSFTTPSFVSFTSEERLIGEAAKNQAAMNPENTVFDVK
jgi:heat shock protein 1/8